VLVLNRPLLRSSNVVVLDREPVQPFPRRRPRQVWLGDLAEMGVRLGVALHHLSSKTGPLQPALSELTNHLQHAKPGAAGVLGMVDEAVLDECLQRLQQFVAELRRAVATSGLAVVFAGGTVVIAILGLAVAGIPFMTAAGVATSLIVGIMVRASITLLPAFLGLVGHRITRKSLRGVASSNDPHDPVSARWQRWGAHVARHAWVYAIGVTLSLIALAAPILDLRLGYPDDGTLPDTRTERRAYDLVAEGFGPGVNGPLLIAIDLPEGTAAVGTLHDAVAGDAGVMAVMPPVVNTEAGVATMIAIPASAPQDEATLATVERLRSDVLPSVLDGSGARAHVGGATASFADMGEKVSDRLPWFIAAVVAMSFLLLTAVFRSVLVPLKAAILNLLSIGAAYGVLVMVFQWGWGAGLIGVESTLPVVSFIPLFMFAVLFGLSMDYEVFLLSRVREEYQRTGDNDQSVVSGLAGTARVISSAALIMISVFLAFVLDPDPMTKMVGLGLASAVLVDATVVRLVLVPATMKLLGQANWWLPSWLDRILPTIDIDGTDSSVGAIPPRRVAA